MFKRANDRRQGYSFIAHVRRITAIKGWSRVAGSLGATALLIGIVFARCSSSSITGPSHLSSTAGTAGSPTPTGHSPDLGGGAPSQYGPIHEPMSNLPPADPCTGQGIVWDEPNSYTNISSTVQLGTDGRLHVRFHMNSLAKGVTDPANNPNGLPNLEYNGNQQDDSQDFVVNDPASDHFHVEWNLKIIAKGNDGSIFDQDDFFLHIVADTPVDITSAVLSGTNYCR